MASLSLLDSVTLVSAGDEKVVRVFSCTTSFTELIESFFGIGSFQIPEGTNISGSAAVPALGLSNKAANDDYPGSKGFGDRDIFSNGDEVRGHTSCFTNSYLTEKTLWSEQNKLYGHGNEVFCVTTFASSNSKLIASSCKATSVDTAVILLWQFQSGSNTFELADSCGGRAHSLTVTDLKFSHDGTLLLSVSRDRSFSVFHVQASSNGSQCKLELLFNKANHHKRIIWKCCWLWNQSETSAGSQTGDYKFLTASRDKTVVLWKLVKPSVVDSPDANVQPELLNSHVMSSGLTAVDVVMMTPSKSSGLGDSFHLVAVGVENGSISLLKIDQLNKFSVLHSLESSSAHVLDVNSLRFSVSKLHVISNNDSEPTLWLASCSNDGIVKLFKIVFGKI